jgi:hypothetical protein
MKNKLLELFESLSRENQEQLFDYAIMLWEMEQGENQLKEQFGFGKHSAINPLPLSDKTDPKKIN